MNRGKLGTTIPELLLIGVVTVAAGCHKNQNAQNATAENPQSTAQPAAAPAPAPAAAETATPAPAATAPAPAASSAPAPAPAAAPAKPLAARHARARSTASAGSGTEQAQATAPAGPDAQAANTPPAPAPIVIPDGTSLRIRINEHISTKTSQDGDKFDGTIVSPVTVNGTVVIPEGSTAYGQVVAAERGGRFKGRPELKLTLVALDVKGRRYNLDTSTVTRTKNGKGKRTAAFIGGGAGAGMLIGGVASGGVGLLVGGLTGAAAGTLGAAFTGHRDIDIPAEAVINFRLDQPIQLQ
jgi:hypothetical protein